MKKKVVRQKEKESYSRSGETYCQLIFVWDVNDIEKQ